MTMPAPTWADLIARRPELRPKGELSDDACCAHAMNVLRRWQKRMGEPQTGDDRDRYLMADAELLKATRSQDSEVMRRSIGVILDLDIL